MPPDLAVLAPPIPVRTFAPLQRVVAREVHGDRAALKLECGHVADAAAAVELVATTCFTCHPIEVLRGR